jgi:hypothetical protein
VNARTEPSVGLTLQAQIPSADRIDLLCAFIKWSGLRLLQPVVTLCGSDWEDMASEQP